MRVWVGDWDSLWDSVWACVGCVLVCGVGLGGLAWVRFGLGWFGLVVFVCFWLALVLVWFGLLMGGV